MNTAVETDCSELVRCCVLYAGIHVNGFSTANEVDELKQTGQFYILEENKYCKAADYLLRGDILVTKTKGHTVLFWTMVPRAARIKKLKQLRKRMYLSAEPIKPR